MLFINSAMRLIASQAPIPIVHCRGLPVTGHAPASDNRALHTWGPPLNGMKGTWRMRLEMPLLGEIKSISGVLRAPQEWVKDREGYAEQN